MTRRADVFAHGLQLEPLLRIQRRQIVEQDLVARSLPAIRS